MSRKLQPIQVVTYPKKIVYKMPENDSKNFFDTFAGIFLINILIVLTSIATGGIGSSIAAGIEVSQFSQALISTSIQSLINFSVNSTFDAIRGHVTSENFIFNALFAITDLGKIGRGLKEDKLIRLLNESDLLTQFGLNQEIKNFHQLQEFFRFKDVLLKDKTKLIFKKQVTDAQLLQSIFLVADSELKKSLKSLSYDQLKTLIDIEKVIYRINPKLIANSGVINVARVDKALASELGIKFDDFLKLDDLEAVNALFKLKSSNIGQRTLNELNLMRMQSNFQRSFYESFKSEWKNLKNKSKKLNPFFWANKFMDKISAPVNELLMEIKTQSLKHLPKINEIGKKLIRDNNLIPCQPDSFLLAFNFQPITLDGSGYITIFKKPYVWKKEARISNYNAVRIWTNILEVEKFVTSPNQSVFYNENWALGYGFKQARIANIAFALKGVRTFYRQIRKFNHHLQNLKIALNTGLVQSTKNLIDKKTQRFLNYQSNSLLSNLISTIPLGSVFTSSMIKSIRRKKWNYSWIKDDLARHSKKKIIRKVIEVKNGRTI